MSLSTLGSLYTSPVGVEEFVLIDTQHSQGSQQSSNETCEVELEEFNMAESFPMPPSSETSLLKTEAPLDVELLADRIDKIPDRMAFKIGDVADMVGVKTYVLRYWETEFDALHPKKSRNKQRVYTRRDVETVMMIKKLLYEDRFSVEGAKAALRKVKKAVKSEKEFRTSVNQYEQIIQRAHKLLHSLRLLKSSLGQ
jgi:DNA-binding transcriptional MerR regulator